MSGSGITKVRLTRRILSHLDGSGLYQRYPGSVYSNDPQVQADADGLVEEIDGAKVRADGSVTIVLTAGELLVLRGQVEVLASASRDDAGWEPEALADLNAARALLRKLPAETG
jgi:hypothetical protein